MMVAQAENPQFKKVSCEGYQVQLISKAGNKKIVPEKLVEQGVTVEQIARATEVGDPSQYVRIDAATEK